MEALHPLAAWRGNVTPCRPQRIRLRFHRCFTTRQFHICSSDAGLQSAIQPRFDPDRRTPQPGPHGLPRDLPSLAFPGHRVVVRHLAWLGMAQNAGQAKRLADRPMRIHPAGRLHHKPLVLQREKLGFQVPVGLLQRARSGFSEAFHQSVLQRLKTAFDAALGLWGVRRDPLDA